MMSSGPIIVAALEKENAVSDLRILIGNTDPVKAEEGTVRKIFGKSMRENAIHASDSDQNAIRESCFFFSELEKFQLSCNYSLRSNLSQSFLHQLISGCGKFFTADPECFIIRIVFITYSFNVSFKVYDH
jgi:hypothetical protein